MIMVVFGYRIYFGHNFFMYILEMASHQDEEILFISELFQVPVSKRGKVRSHWYENVFLFSFKLNSISQNRILHLASL